MLTLNAEDFSVFTALVAQRTETLVTCGDRRKSIVMPTPFAHCQVLLTEAELQDLHNLLQHADNELKSIAMLRLFE